MPPASLPALAAISPGPAMASRPASSGRRAPAGSGGGAPAERGPARPGGRVDAAFRLRGVRPGASLVGAGHCSSLGKCSRPRSGSRASSDVVGQDPARAAGRCRRPPAARSGGCGPAGRRRPPTDASVGTVSGSGCRSACSTVADQLVVGVGDQVEQWQVGHQVAVVVADHHRVDLVAVPARNPATTRLTSPTVWSGRAGTSAVVMNPPALRLGIAEQRPQFARACLGHLAQDAVAFGRGQVAQRVHRLVRLHRGQQRPRPARVGPPAAGPAARPGPSPPARRPRCRGPAGPAAPSGRSGPGPPAGRPGRSGQPAQLLIGWRSCTAGGRRSGPRRTGSPRPSRSPAPGWAPAQEPLARAGAAASSG